MKTCSFHNIEAEFKEGISKRTGKGYSFWACSQKNPDGSFCKADLIEGNGVSPKSALDWENSLKEEKTIRSERIERQHSQEMALRFLDLLVRTGQLQEVNKDLVEGYTNHFQNDLNSQTGQNGSS